jgi:hypothetical protein
VNQVIMSVQSVAKVITFFSVFCSRYNRVSCVRMLAEFWRVKARRDNSIFPFDKRTRAFLFVSKLAVKLFVGYLLISKL